MESRKATLPQPPRGSTVGWALAALVLTASMVGCSNTPYEEPDAVALDLSTTPTTIQLIAFSEWAAAIEPIYKGSPGEHAGAETLAAYWQRDERAYPDATLVVTNGDAFGVSPPLSAFFDERPATIALNMMGLDVDTFGNHNFDRGLDHLQERVLESDYAWVAANLTNVPQNLREVAPYTIKMLDGVPVAVIGIVDPTAPDRVFPGSWGTMTVTDPVEAAVDAYDMAKEAGATVFVALVHLEAGADVVEFDDGLGHDDAGSYSGPLLDFAHAVQERTGNGFHVIMGGPESPSFFCGRAADGSMSCDHRFKEELPALHPGDPLPSAVSVDPAQRLVILPRDKGRVYIKTLLTVVPATGEVVSQSVEFVYPIASDVTPTGRIDEALQPFVDEVSQELDRPLFQVTQPFAFSDADDDPANPRYGQTELGTLVADAIRSYTGADIAILNGGSIRDGLPSGYDAKDPSLSRDASPYDVVVGDIYAMLPFANLLVNVEVDAATLWEMAEVSAASFGGGGLLQVSGMRYYVVVQDNPDPDGPPVVAELCGVEVGGEFVWPDSEGVWTLAANDYLAQGGDNYLMLVSDASVPSQLVSFGLIDTFDSYEVVLSPVDFSTPGFVKLGSQASCPKP